MSTNDDYGIDHDDGEDDDGDDYDDDKEEEDDGDDDDEEEEEEEEYFGANSCTRMQSHRRFCNTHCCCYCCYSPCKGMRADITMDSPVQMAHNVQPERMADPRTDRTAGSPFTWLSWNHIAP